MGYRVHTYSPDRDSPTGQIADEEIDAPYEDLDRVREFASAVDVVTFEFENVPAATADAASSARWCDRRATFCTPPSTVCARRRSFARHGFPSRGSSEIRFLTTIRSGVVPEFGPAILKTAGFGYDGKGQYQGEVAGGS